MNNRCPWAAEKSGAYITGALQLYGIEPLQADHAAFVTYTNTLVERVALTLFTDEKLSKKARDTANKFAERQRKKGKEMTQEAINAKAFSIFKSDISTPLKKVDGNHTYMAKTKAFRVKDYNAADYEYDAIDLHFYDKDYNLITEEGFELGSGAIVAPVLQPVVTKMPGTNKINVSFRLNGHFVVYSAGSVQQKVSRDVIADKTRPFVCITKENNRGGRTAYVNDANGNMFLTEISGALYYNLESTRGRIDGVTEATAKYSASITIDEEQRSYLEGIVNACKKHVLEDNTLHDQAKAKWREEAATLADDDSEEALQESFQMQCDSAFSSPFVNEGAAVSVKCKEFTPDGNGGFDQILLKTKNEDSDETEDVTSIPRDTHISVVVTPYIWMIPGTGAWGVSFNMARNGTHTQEIIIKATDESEMQGPSYDF